jgi:hypothetical protein
MVNVLEINRTPEFIAEYERLAAWRERWNRLSHSTRYKLASQNDRIEEKAARANNMIGELMKKFDANQAQPNGHICPICQASNPTAVCTNAQSHPAFERARKGKETNTQEPALEILPCPFCGSSPGAHNLNGAWRVLCGCDAEGPCALGKRDEPEYMFQCLYDAARAEIVRATREEDCKAMCRLCESGKIPELDAGIWKHYYAAPTYFHCEAWPIWDLIAKEK